MKTTRFCGVMPALVTPLETDNRTVNTAVVETLVERLLRDGADGFYILGATGEGLAILREEREKLCVSVIRAVAHRVPIICHIASMNLDEAIALARHAERCGADAVAAIPPIFFFYDSEDIYLYYKRLAESVHIPLIIYQHPAAQKNMKAEAIARIFEIDNVTGIKWSTGDYYELMRLKDITQGEMNIINGSDEMLVCGLAAGADAGIGSTYNLMIRQYKEIYRLFTSGDVNSARKLQLRVNRVIDVLLRHECVPSIKYALGADGISVGTCRFPMRQIGTVEGEKLMHELLEAGFPFET